MTCKTHEWLDKVSGLSNDTEIKKASQEYVSDPDVNSVSAYSLAQEEARKLLEAKQQLPEGMVKAIRALGLANSGFTGLTVHEAFVFSLRKKQ